MTTNKALLGALAGALIAVIWIAWDGAAVILVAALAAAGWMLGMIFERPDVLIAWLKRIEDR